MKDSTEYLMKKIKTDILMLIHRLLCALLYNADFSLLIIHHFMQLKKLCFVLFRLLDIIDAYEKQVLGLQKQIEFYK